MAVVDSEVDTDDDFFTNPDPQPVLSQPKTETVTPAPPEVSPSDSGRRFAPKSRFHSWLHVS